MNAIFTRRSVRSFTEQEVEPEKIERILKAAMQAPSAHNQQPWEFIVVRNKETLKKISKMHQYSSCLENAPLGIIILTNKSKLKIPEFIQQDLSACTQNLMVEATDLNLGTVWFGLYPIDETIKYIKSLFNLDDEIIPFSVVAVGYPKSENALKHIDRYEPDRIHYEKW